MIKIESMNLDDLKPLAIWGKGDSSAVFRKKSPQALQPFAKLMALATDFHQMRKLVEFSENCV
jgi:hypothetical protein